MEIIKYNEFDEVCYKEELDNGLKVYIFHKPLFNTSYCAFGTPYGALDIHQKYNGKHYDFHPGIAHFLEHKVFEVEGEDVLNKFAFLGASVNAFTSYRETVYHFSMSGEENFNEALNLLLNFTQKLSVSEESIEKEKPIINQEISMYQQMPDTRLLNESFSAIYKNFPMKYDIGGDEENVNAITLDELKTCYDINYHPSNMILSIVSFIDPLKIIEVIKENQAHKSFTKIKPAISDNLNEPKEVNEIIKEFDMDVSSIKNTYTIKLDLHHLSNLELIRYEHSIRTILQACFTNLNKDYQKWLDEKVINDFFGFDLEFEKDGAYIIFYSENNTKEELKDLVDKTLNNFKINEDILNQLKRRFIGNFFDEFNDLEMFNITYLRYLLDGVDAFDVIKVYKELTIDQIINDFNNLDLSNYSLVSLKPKN